MVLWAFEPCAVPMPVKTAGRVGSKVPPPVMVRVSELEPPAMVAPGRPSALTTTLVRWDDALRADPATARRNAGTEAIMGKRSMSNFVSI